MMTQNVTHLSDYDTSVRHAATVVTSLRITGEQSEEEIRELVIDVAGPAFECKAGQCIGVIVPGAGTGDHEHFRLYTIADLPDKSRAGVTRMKLCIKRCSYIDRFSGQRFPGIASNYLCDLKPGQKLTITGPYGLAFSLPDETGLTVVMIAVGTGIAPFRAFTRHIYENERQKVKRVWLFYGARSGLELLYMNDRNADFTKYYDEETFKAFTALSPRPNWADPIAWDGSLAERGEELWNMFADPKTYVFVAGIEPLRGQLDRVFSAIAGSEPRWASRKAELVAAQRWTELLY